MDALIQRVMDENINDSEDSVASFFQTTWEEFDNLAIGCPISAADDAEKSEISASSASFGEEGSEEEGLPPPPPPRRSALTSERKDYASMNRGDEAHVIDIMAVLANEQVSAICQES